MKQNDSLLYKIKQEMDQLCAERDWEYLNSPKNLAMNLHVEAGELAEHFTWLTEEQSRQLSPEKIQEVADELGDVLINVVHLADKLGIDAVAAALQKLEKIKAKYPVELTKGKIVKYTAVQGKTGV